MTHTQANEPGFVLANEARPDPRIAPLAKAMEAKRAELIGQPLSFIWGDLAQVALASAPIVPAPAYGVKALEWREPTDHPEDNEDALLIAEGLGGRYSISQRQSLHNGGTGHLLWWAHDGFRFAEFHTPNQAKAAAQADFEHRILSCLSSAPVEEADAKAGELNWTANCVRCGRIVDTREEKDGGDKFGCELSRGGWTCSFECWEAEVDATDDGAGPYGGAKADEEDTPPASTIPSEPEAKGEAGAGPVGEAVAWCAHPDQTSPMTVGPESFLEEPDAILTALDLAIEWLEIDPVAEERGVVERIKDARRVYARLVEELGEVERLTREWDDAVRRHLLDYERAERETARADAAEAALAETRESLEKMEAAVRPIVEASIRSVSDEIDIPDGASGAIWITMGEVRAIRAALSTQESSAALAGDGKERGR